MNMKHAISIALGLSLAACGGGGDPATPAVAERAPVPEGVYNGDTALTDQFNSTLVALENGETWYLGTRNFGYGNFTYRGLGPASTNGIQPSIYHSDAFQIVGTTWSTVPLPGATITQEFQYTETATGATVRLTAPQTEVAIMPRIPTDRYVYEQRAQVETLAGEWGWTSGPNGQSISWTVQGSSVTAPESYIEATGGRTVCAASGTVEPRGTGRNVFDVLMRFTGASCTLAGRDFRGIAVQYTADPFLARRPVFDIGVRSTDGTTLATIRLKRPLTK